MFHYPETLTGNNQGIYPDIGTTPPGYYSIVQKWKINKIN